jgi:DNA polymerase-3 subunit epsilon
VGKRVLFLDTETTGLSPRFHSIVELAIVDERGWTVMNTLVDPERTIPPDASAIHGITDAMLADAPTLEDLWPQVERVVAGAHIVIYNANFDTKFFPDYLGCAGAISCAMKAFARVQGVWNPRYNDYKWHKLSVAASHVGYVWTGDAHRALADALACRSVWIWLRDKSAKAENVSQKKSTRAIVSKAATTTPNLP